MAYKLGKTHMKYIHMLLTNNGYIEEQTNEGFTEYWIMLETVGGAYLPWQQTGKLHFNMLLKRGIIKSVGGGRYELAVDSPEWAKNMIIDPETRLQLLPGDPSKCEGSGKHINIDGDVDECCCDECDFLELCANKFEEEEE